jgi:bacterioferritin-associated ferredoxin
LIVCSCNVLTDKQIVAAARGSETTRPCSPAQAYRGLGCAPRCGRCVPTIRALLAGAHIANCEATCRNCPAKESDARPQNVVEPALYLMAAE